MGCRARDDDDDDNNNNNNNNNNILHIRKFIVKSTPFKKQTQLICTMKIT
jgi:hypothetical protein